MTVHGKFHFQNPAGIGGGGISAASSSARSMKILLRREAPYSATATKDRTARQDEFMDCWIIGFEFKIAQESWR